MATDDPRLPADGGDEGEQVADDTSHPPMDESDEGEPLDPHELPIAQLGAPREDEPDQPHHRQERVWWFVGITAAVVVIGLAIGIVVFNRSVPGRVHGALTAREAAVKFVAAVNAGSERRAAAISCETFVDDAKAVARTGQDRAFSLHLSRVRMDGSTSATAIITSRLRLPGQVQTQPANITVLRQSGLWLMCGRVS